MNAGENAGENADGDGDGEKEIAIAFLAIVGLLSYASLWFVRTGTCYLEDRLCKNSQRVKFE